MTENRAACQTRVVAYQGAAGAFSHEAAGILTRAVMPEDEIAYSNCQSFAEVFDAVENSTNYGVVPLENSSVGSIVANYDLLWSGRVTLVAETFLPIHHQLIAHKKAKLTDIKTVMSHPVALDQCRRLFKENPQIKLENWWDTGGAVEQVATSGDTTIAAIGSAFAARHYKLAILKENVEDFPHNTTRFGLIVKAKQAPEPPAHLKPLKLSLAFELPHKPGALSSVLAVMSASRLNLTKIESRPAPETPWHYRFFIDVELQDRELAETVIDQLDMICNRLLVLGIYPCI